MINNKHSFILEYYLNYLEYYIGIIFKQDRYVKFYA